MANPFDNAKCLQILYVLMHRYKIFGINLYTIYNFGRLKFKYNGKDKEKPLASKMNSIN